MVTQVSTELKQNKQTNKPKNLEKGMKSNEEHDTKRMGETSKQDIENFNQYID